MVSEKQFRQRAGSDLRQIGDQVLALATDRDIYRRLEQEIIQHNAQLNDMRSAVLDMIRGCYAEAMAGRVLRLLDPDGPLSLPRVLSSLAHYPHLLHDKISEHEFNQDRAALELARRNLSSTMVPHIAHHERTLPALAALHCKLDAAIDLLINAVKTYYWIVAESYIDLDVRYSEDPLAVFQFAWLVPALAT